MQGDVVVSEHDLEDLLVSRLFESLQGNRFTEQGVVLHLCQCLNARCCPPLSFYCCLPEGKTAQTGQGVLRKNWPVDFRSLVRIMGIEKHPAEKPLMHFRAK